MAEPRTARRMRFTADTIEGLRDQLNRWADEMADEFETENLITKGVQFIPVRGPYYKDSAPHHLLFLREYEIGFEKDATSATPALKALNIISDTGYANEKMWQVTIIPQILDADGAEQDGGLHD